MSLPVISVYTWDDAVRDGTFQEVTPTAREAGFRFRVAVAPFAWEKAVALEPDAPADQSETGRLWDILTLARFAIQRSDPDPHRRAFTVSVARAHGSETVALSVGLDVNPFTGEPAITIFHALDD